MATKRQQAEWARAAIMTARLMGCWTKEPVDPLTLIPEPYRPGPRREPTQEEKAEQKKLFWRVVDHL